MLHDLFRGVTVRENIEEIDLGHEIETWEGTPLALHEVEQGLFTDRKLLLSGLQVWKYPFLSTVGQSDLLGESVCENTLHILIDDDELVRLLGKLFLHFGRVDKELFEEGPVTLDLTGESNDFSNIGESLLPLDALFLKRGQVARREHTIDLGLHFFEHLKVFFTQ